MRWISNVIRETVRVAYIDHYAGTMHFYSSILDYPINARIRPLYSATLTSPIIRYHSEQLIFIFKSITHCLLCLEWNVENSIVFSTRFRSCETSTGVIIIWKLHSSPIDRTRWFLSFIFYLGTFLKFRATTNCRSECLKAKNLDQSKSRWNVRVISLHWY